MHADVDVDHVEDYFKDSHRDELYRTQFAQHGTEADQDSSGGEVGGDQTARRKQSLRDRQDKAAPHRASKSCVY